MMKFIKLIIDGNSENLINVEQINKISVNNAYNEYDIHIGNHVISVKAEHIQSLWDAIGMRL